MHIYLKYLQSCFCLLLNSHDLLGLDSFLHPFRTMTLFFPSENHDVFWQIPFSREKAISPQSSHYTKQTVFHLMQGWNRTSNSCISMSDDSFPPYHPGRYSSIVDHIRKASSMPIPCPVTYMLRTSKQEQRASAHK